MEVKDILERVRTGKLSVEEAEQYLRRQPFEEMGFAKLDTHRELRSGFPEVIYCAGKPDEYLVSIFQKMYEKNGGVFGTRATAAQYELVRRSLPQVQYDSVSKILKIEEDPEEKLQSESERLLSARRGRRTFQWRRRLRRRQNILVLV